MALAVAKRPRKAAVIFMVGGCSALSNGIVVLLLRRSEQKDIFGVVSLGRKPT